MAQYIDKSALVAEIERQRKIYMYDVDNRHSFGRMMECNDLLVFLDTLEVKEVQEGPVSNPTPNKKMPVERWKMACEAACYDGNYRSHYGLTETRDDYFVDGVQWADEHPKEEPVSSIWHDGCEIPKSGTNILMIRKDENDSNYPPIAGCFHGTNLRLDGRNWGYYNGFCYNEIEPPVKWVYIDDILKM